MNEDQIFDLVKGLVAQAHQIDADKVVNLMIVNDRGHISNVCTDGNLIYRTNITVDITGITRPYSGETKEEYQKQAAERLSKVERSLGLRS